MSVQTASSECLPSNFFPNSCNLAFFRASFKASSVALPLLFFFHRRSIALALRGSFWRSDCFVSPYKTTSDNPSSLPSFFQLRDRNCRARLSSNG